MPAKPGAQPVHPIAALRRPNTVLPLYFLCRTVRRDLARWTRPAQALSRRQLSRATKCHMRQYAKFIIPTGMNISERSVYTRNGRSDPKGCPSLRRAAPMTTLRHAIASYFSARTRRLCKTAPIKPIPARNIA
jgi:hypothetical protein